MKKFFHLLTNARYNVYRSIGTILCSEKTFSETQYDNFLRSRFNGSPTHFWPSTKVKINVLSLTLKQLSAGDLVEASSNLFAIVKTTARKIFTASSLRKKSRDFFRLRSNSGVDSSSIFDCTAHNAAYCDAGNGTPQKGFWLLSQWDSKSLIWLVELVLCGPLKSNMRVWGGIPPQ